MLMAFATILFGLGTRPPFDDYGEDWSLGGPLFYAAWLPTYRLGILGDVDAFELEGWKDPASNKWESEDPKPTRNFPYVHITYYGAALILTTILLQLLVGILGGEYDRYEDQSMQLFMQTRAACVCELSTLPWARGLAWIHKKFWDLSDDDRCFYAIPDDPSLHEEKNMRAILKQIADKHSKKLGDKVDALSKQLNGQQSKELGEKLDALSKQLNGQQSKELGEKVDALSKEVERGQRDLEAVKGNLEAIKGDLNEIKELLKLKHQ